MPKKLIEIASEIVQTQVGRMAMSAEEIASSLRKVFSALQELQKAEIGGTVLEVLSEENAPDPAQEQQVLTPENSIQNDKVTCLECGAEMRQLTQKHLIAHGMDQREYKKKYGFPMKTPLAAKNLTKARSKAAKKRGLPEKLKLYLSERRQNKSPNSIPAESGEGRLPERTKVVRSPRRKATTKP